MQGITQDKIKRQILRNFTFSNKIQAWKIEKFKQYYLAINSCLCFTQPVSFITLIVNSLPNSPVISTPTRLETVHSALLWSPSHVPLVGTMSAASCSLWMSSAPRSSLWVSCAPRSVHAWPAGPGHCFPADQTEKTKVTSHSAQVTHCCSGDDKRSIGSVAPATWAVTHSPCLWPNHQSECKPGSGSVTKHEVQFYKLQLTEQIQHRASCPSAWGDSSAFRTQSNSPCLTEVSHAGRINLSSELLISQSLLERQLGQLV